MKTIEIKTIVNEKTGEVCGEKTRKYNILDEKKGYYLKYNSKTIKQYPDIKLSAFIKDKSDFMRIHLLAENLYNGTNELMIRVNNRKLRYMTIEDIANVIGLCKERANKFINRMIRLEIMARQTNKVGESEYIVYVMNPLFFNSCKYIEPSLYFLFENTLSHYMPANARDWYHEVGNIKKEV